MDYEPAFSGRPTYLLEDESDDSDWETEQPPATASAINVKELPREPHVQLVGDTDKLEKGHEVVFLTGEAGERLAQGVELGDRDVHELIQVVVEGEQYGAILPSSARGRATLVFLSSSIPLAFLHPLAEFLLETLAPTFSTIVGSYHLPSYINPSSTESPTAFKSRLPILFLASPSSSPSASPLASLRANGTIEPYTPPNLLHGLAASLLTLSSLVLPALPTTLLLLPTSTPPQPLNGPFSPLSPVTQPRVVTLFDAGGPTGLSDPTAQFRHLAADKLPRIKAALEWDWWTLPASKPGDRSTGKEQVTAGRGFEWLETARKARRKEETSSMFM
ncbi:hypothetical protein JCM11491_006400 [Sporobolomyces phaffii]